MAEPRAKLSDVFLKLLDNADDISTKLKDTATKKDFILAYEQVLDRIRALEESVRTRLEGHLADVRSGVDGKDGRDGKDGKDGTTPTTAELIRLVEEVMPEADALDEIQLKNSIQNDIEKRLPQFGTAYRDGLELLQGEERLDATAIKNLPQATQQIAQRAGWGAHPLMVQQSGTIKTKLARVLNFVGATVAQQPDGVTKITITGGSGGFTVEEPTGTVDGSNKTFTVSADPVYIVIDGITYFENNGYTLSGTTITTTVAPTGFIRSFYS